METSPRSLPGAMTAAPAFGVTGPGSATPASHWDAVVAEWRRVRAIWDPIAVAASTAEGAYWKDPSNTNKAEYERLSESSREWMERDDTALREVMATPAPSIQAVILKLELGEEHCLSEAIGSAVADLRHLAVEGR